jgi:hypothetical protein
MILFAKIITVMIVLLLVMWTNHWVIEETEVDE